MEIIAYELPTKRCIMRRMRYFMLIFLFLLSSCTGSRTVATVQAVASTHELLLRGAMSGDLVVDVNGIGASAGADLDLSVVRKSDGANVFQRQLVLGACEGLRLVADALGARLERVSGPVVGETWVSLRTCTPELQGLTAQESATQVLWSTSEL